MQYAVLDSSNVLHALLELDSPDSWSGPDGFRLVEAEGVELDGDYADYEYSEGAFRKRDLPPAPYEPTEAVAVVLDAQGATVGISDSDAARMAVFIPAFDASRSYSEGELAVRNGVVCRRTSIGWREIG